MDLVACVPGSGQAVGSGRVWGRDKNTMVGTLRMDKHQVRFLGFFQEHGIIAQYTMSGSPNQNGVAERRDRSLMDMLRSMRNNKSLPHFLWTEALKTSMYILN